MKKYESIFIIDSNVADDQINPIVDKVKALIEKFEGTVDGCDLWGRKRLAYEINKKNEGYFVLINFTAKEDFPKELDRNFRIMDSIIRHIIVKKEN